MIDFDVKRVTILTSYNSYISTATQFQSLLIQSDPTVKIVCEVGSAKGRAQSPNPKKHPTLLLAQNNPSKTNSQDLVNN